MAGSEPFPAAAAMTLAGGVAPNLAREWARAAGPLLTTETGFGTCLTVKRLSEEMGEAETTVARAAEASEIRWYFMMLNLGELMVRRRA